MSCQGNFLSGAKSAAQNGVSKIASMSAAAGGRAGAAFSAGKDKAQSAISVAGDKVAPITQNKAFRHFTRGPRASIGAQMAYTKGHLRIAKAVGGFIGDVVKAEKALGSVTSENLKALKEAKAKGQAKEPFVQIEQANITAYKTSVKGAAKKLFSEVRGAQGDIIGGYTGAWRTMLGR